MRKHAARADALIRRIRSLPPEKVAEVDHFADQERRLFLPMAVVERLFARPGVRRLLGQRAFEAAGGDRGPAAAR